MLPNFDHLGIFKTNSISNQLSSFLMKLIRIIYVLPSFENMKTVYEPHIIFKETDAKLKRWSKFGLLRYLFIIINCCTIFMIKDELLKVLMSLFGKSTTLFEVLRIGDVYPGFGFSPLPDPT